MRRSRSESDTRAIENYEDPEAKKDVILFGHSVCYGMNRRKEMPIFYSSSASVGPGWFCAARRAWARMSTVRLSLSGSLSIVAAVSAISGCTLWFTSVGDMFSP